MASEPTKPGHDERDGEPETRTAPETTMTEPIKTENDPITSDIDMHKLQERLREMESKMIAVDQLYSLHKSTAEAMEYSNRDPATLPWHNRGNDPETYRERFDFYTDVLFFMRKSRESHQKLVERDLARKQEIDSLGNYDHSKEDYRREEASVGAFLKGERLKLTQMEWDQHLSASCLSLRPPVDEDFFAPIEIISGEPDSKTILQPFSDIRSLKADTIARPRVERIAPLSTESIEQEPLPERIEIRLTPLMSIFDEIDRKIGNTKSLSPPQKNAPISHSTIFLRPYQEFSYKEQGLRDWLTMLEDRFKDYGELQQSPSLPNGTHEENNNGNECRESSDEGPAILQSPQSEREPHSDRSEKAENRSVEPPGPAKSFEGITIEEEYMMEKSRTYKLAHSVSALLHLRCLMEFLDKEIKPKREYVRSSRCTRIHFHDLWHLFKPGDEVVEQDGKQAFIVMRVQVPRHSIEEPWNRWNTANDSESSASDSDSDGGNDNDDDNDGPFRLHCAYIDFDGKIFGPVSKNFKISPYDEPKLVTSLPVLPLRHLQEAQARQDLITRGQTLLEVSKFKAMYYTGVTLDRREEIDSQVVIDFNEALTDEKRRKAWEPTIGNLNTTTDSGGPRCTANCCRHKLVCDGFDFDSKMTEDHIKSLFADTSMGASSLILQPRSLEEILSSPEKLTETELLIMTYRVFGFVLRSRKWAQLDLGILRHENKNARILTVNAFDSLELPENHREVLKSLVVQHFRSKQSALINDEQTDLIQGKGKGLILLLHGAPGVGKTTTAEGIAQLFKRPLFQITCGDLGTTAGEVEAELEKNFSLASRWGCILLLDEADVFLSARERMDFKRNGLVAVFLRVLEYYSGILFLTTNRIGDFDEAFSSRIHMSLYYPPLDEESTWKVFKLNLNLIKDRLNGQGRNITFDESAVEKFARSHFQNHEFNRWNGRQIRNACQTALALADFDSQGGSMDIDGEIDKHAVVQLQLKYFETVQKAYLDFGEYLGDIQGTQGDSRAIDYKLRARKDTPYQQKRNAFSQHENSRSGKGQRNLYPEYPHGQRSFSNVSESNFGSQGDQFSQGYAPATPNANTSRSQGYDPYSSHPGSMYSSQRQSRGASMANRDPYDRSSEGSQQYQSDQRFPQGGARGQRFESPRMSDRFIPSVEEDRYASPGYDDSPLPHRPAQRPSQTHGYDNPNEGDIAQSRNPVQGPSSYNPNSIFRSRRDDIGN